MAYTCAEVIVVVFFYAVRVISSLSPADRGDLEYILECHHKDIVANFAKYTSRVQQLIEEEKIEVDTLCEFLVGFAGGDTRVALISCEKVAELDKAKSIGKIFRFLKIECASFLSYDIFEHIMDRFGIDRNDKDYSEKVKGDLDYPKKLKEYVEKHNIEQFIERKPVLAEYGQIDDKVKLIMVFDIDLLSKVDKLLNIVKAIAKIIDDKLPSNLLIYGIKGGCVEVTVLIPKELAECIFTSDKAFSDHQKEELQRLLVRRLECNSYTYNFVSAREDCNLKEIGLTQGKLVGMCS